MNAKNLYPDLFPETLLVQVENGKAIVTSLKLSECFEKRHTHVLKQIQALGEPNFRLTSDKKDEGDASKNGRTSDVISAFVDANFELSFYVDKWNRKKPMYKMTHDGFALLAMGFTGQKALEWKIQFLNAFREMERQLQERNNRWVRVIDQVRPSLRPVVEGTEQNLSRAEIAERIGKSVNSVTYYRGRARGFDILH